MDNSDISEDKVREAFKIPLLIGKVGKLPKKVPDTKRKREENNEEKDKTKNESLPSSNSAQSVPSNSAQSVPSNSAPPVVLNKDVSLPVPYKEPKWSGLCPDGSDYALDVLKSGVIVERIDLISRPYYVFGRFLNCNIIMAHPTISRHHCILQYRAFAEEGEPHGGWYLYDLRSTHGTFLNKKKIKPNHYTRVKVGHQFKFGTSTQTYILLGPEFDCEGESELTVTEIKQKALERKSEKERMIKEYIAQKRKEKAEEEKRQEETGIDWGMGEDAEDETDLTDNPYASTANEELYLDDPKKTLRGYFEREGEELKYDCEERGVGQFMCRVVLPLDDASGLPMTAEVMHRGKKKDAVVACALEACRILDRAGLLRQAKHESRKRKARDWSADDFYDSDEDSYLDRTGTVERKRERRMVKHGAAARGEDVRQTEPLTYEDLLKQISELQSKIAMEEKNLQTLRALQEQPKDQNGEDVDELEQFMLNLRSQGQSMSHKAEISNAKMNIKKLQANLAKTRKLAEIARPAHMLPIIKKENQQALMKVTSNAVIYGKRVKLKQDQEKKHRIERTAVGERKEEDAFEVEMDSDEELQFFSESINQNVTPEKQSHVVLPEFRKLHEDPFRHLKTQTERKERVEDTSTKTIDLKNNETKKISSIDESTFESHAEKDESKDTDAKKNITEKCPKNIQGLEKDSSGSLKTEDKNSRKHKKKKSHKRDDKKDDGKSKEKSRREKEVVKRNSSSESKKKSERKKERTSEKSKERDKVKQSINEEMNKDLGIKNTKQNSVKKHKTSGQAKSDGNGKQNKHKGSSKREHKTEHRADVRVKSEDKYKGNESSTEISNVERKRPHIEEKQENEPVNRKIIDDKQSDKTTQSKDVNEQIIIVYSSNEEKGMSASDENEPLQVKKEKKHMKVYGPMGPPVNYVTPENYFEQTSDRDLPEITEEEIVHSK